jgi:hypothetical protein
MVELKRTRQLGALAHTWESSVRTQYSYLLGMYLGDGCISRTGRTLKLPIFLDAGYPGIVDECRGAMGAVMPTSRPNVVQRPGRPKR